jgi:2-oxoglutarate dehydrogenase E2 component (dihydrolipoamide succinyltransferase)
VRHTVKLPKLSETIDEMIVLEWLVALGTQVVEGQALVSVETDKVTVEMPSPVAGVLVEQLVEPDDEVTTGAIIAIIES